VQVIGHYTDPQEIYEAGNQNETVTF